MSAGLLKFRNVNKFRNVLLLIFKENRYNEHSFTDVAPDFVHKVFDMTDMHSEQTRSHKDRLSRTLIIVLLAINMLFIAFIFIHDAGKPSSEEMSAEVQNLKHAVMNTYEIELPLTRYVLLKIEIRKNIQEHKNKEIIQKNISQAIEELESILSRDRVKSVLNREKRESLEKELCEMKQLGRSYGTGPESHYTKGSHNE